MAKSRFSELVNEAQVHGAQFITLDGSDSVVLLSDEEYRRLSKREPTFVEFLLTGPKTDDFEIGRDKDRGRNFEFEDDSE